MPSQLTRLEELAYTFERLKKRFPILDCNLAADIELFQLDLKDLIDYEKKGCYNRCCDEET